MRWVPNFRLSLRVSLPLTIAVLLALPLAGWGQQELRSGKKGVTAPAPITSTSVDADTQALDVAIKAGSITLSGADGAILDGANPTVKATVTGSNALKVDGSAVTQPVSGTVTVQQGTGTNLHMVCDSGCGGSAGFADNSAFTFGTTAVNPIAGVLDDVATNAATENAAAVIRMTAQKGLHVNLRNVSGTELGTAGAPFRIDPTGTTTQPISGTITANAGTNLNTSALALDATVTGRFPASFSSADAVAAQTATFLHGGMMGWNGTGWDRLQVDASKNLKILINAAIPTGANTIGAVNLAQYTPVTGRLPVDGSGVTQPVSGTITANIGTSGSLALDATLTGGTAKSVVRGGAKGTSTAADVTSTSSGANHQILDVAIYDNAGNQITSFGGAGGTSSNFGSAFPTPGTAIGFTDGTNMQPGRVVDADSGAGTVNVQGVNLLKRASGGPVEAGTATDPLRTDPTGTTTQPVSGTVTANQGGTWNIGTVTTLPALPANQSVNVAQINGVTPLMGNGTTGTGSPRVTIASDNTAFSVNAVQSTAAATTAPWPVSNGTVARTSASWTSATPVDTALTLSTAGFAVVGLTTNTTTTITAGMLNFEASDDSGVTWFTIPCTAMGSAVFLTPINTYAIAANTKIAWQCPIAGYDRMRVRINPALTGTGQITVGLAGSASGQVTSLTANNNIASIVGNTAATAATGTLKVGIVGNAAGAFDSANNAAAPANVLAAGFESATQGTTQPTASTAGNMRRAVISTDGALYTRRGGPVTWSCGLTALAATLTQCQAAPAAGLKLYITDIIAVSDTATAGQFTLRYGTGANCGTGTTTLFPNVASITTGKLPYPANSAAQPLYLSFQTPIAVPTAANALCAVAVATNTATIEIHGYTAP